MRLYCGLCTDLLEFALWLRKTSATRQSDENCATSHRLKWGPLSPNEVGRVAQHVWKGEGRKGWGKIFGIFNLAQVIVHE